MIVPDVEWGSMEKVLSGVAVNLDQNILEAAFPLFEKAEIECVEWAFDTLYRYNDIPDWFKNLLESFGKEDRLLGHGVFFSLLNGRFSSDQIRWLNDLEKITKDFNFSHVSEHFGFMTGKDFHNGAPLNVPLTKATLDIAVDRIKRISEACGVPVGLENLAFCYEKDSVLKQGEFLEKILSPVNGFLILDLHNIYCQTQNFKLSFEELIKEYPLHLVREIHISGGSWRDSSIDDFKIRRDTHDDGVPTEVFDYLKTVLPILPNVRYVILEQLGTGLKNKEQKHRFRSDFKEMKGIVDKYQKRSKILNHFMPISLSIDERPVENIELYQEQRALSAILENSATLDEVHIQLHSSLAHTNWEIEKWDKRMIETAYEIAQKWK